VQTVYTLITGGIIMPERKIENYLGNVLTGDTRKNAAALFVYLLAHELQFERGQGYWADKLYWMIKHNDEYICFILINNAEDNTEPVGLTVWLDDGRSNCFANLSPDERTKEIAWKHIDICGNCGGCGNPGGSRKTIFGNEFDNVCVTPMRFDNPDAETVECVMKLIGLICEFSQ